MSHPKTILVLESEKLLAAAVVSLLASRPEFAVTGATFSSLARLDQLNHTEPDVIIMDEDLVANNITAVMELVDRHPRLRLIVLGLSDNQLHVFDKHIVQVTEVNDFIAQLQSAAG